MFARNQPIHPAKMWDKDFSTMAKSDRNVIKNLHYLNYAVNKKNI